MSRNNEQSEQFNIGKGWRPASRAMSRAKGEKDKVNCERAGGGCNQRRIETE